MLTADEVEHFTCHGWFVRRGFLGADLDALRAALQVLFPTPEEYWSDPVSFPSLRGDQFESVRTVPTGLPILDHLPFADAFRAIAAELTGVTDLRLLRAGYQAKFAGAADFEQVLHRDYGNHTLVVPPPGPAPTLLGFFVYFTDVTDADGPTMVVSADHTRSLHMADTHLARDMAAAIYEVEEPIICDAGTLLVYDNRTFHRGTALQGRSAHRLSLSFAYGVAAPWHGFISWPNRAEEPAVRSLVAGLSADQRTLLGFPPTGDPYWTEQTIDGVRRRYPTLDPTPYEQALARPTTSKAARDAT